MLPSSLQVVRKWLAIAILQFVIAIVIFQFYGLFITTTINKIEIENNNCWPNTPRLSLLIRLYHGAVAEYWQIFAASYLLFWPVKKWPNSDLVLIFDDEAIQDHQASTVLSLLPPYPKIFFEKSPRPNTLCSNWRREGYARQIYSNFYADLYTDAEFIGITDSDTYFTGKVIVDDLFDKQGRPRLSGYNGCCTGWTDAAGSIVPGKPRPGEFMTGMSFPFIVRREHFKAFRRFAITTYINVKDFEEFFNRICINYHEYSQFNLLAYYLFHYHRNDYAWHLRDNKEAKHPFLQSGRSSHDPEVLAFSVPKIGVMKHSGHADHHHFPFIIYDYICTEANFSAKLGSCSREVDERRDAKIRQVVHYNMMTDLVVKNAYWHQRKMPFNSSMALWPVVEKIPENTEQLFEERTNKIIEIYNNSWHW